MARDFKELLLFVCLLSRMSETRVGVDLHNIPVDMHRAHAWVENKHKLYCLFNFVLVLLLYYCFKLEWVFLQCSFQQVIRPKSSCVENSRWMWIFILLYWGRKEKSWVVNKTQVFHGSLWTLRVQRMTWKEESKNWRGKKS